MGSFKAAFCQFAVSGDILTNSKWIVSFMKEASGKGADIVHFSECALGGYAGVDIAGFDRYDWALLDSETEKIKLLAAELGIWVVLGTNYRDQESAAVHNSLLLINEQGQVCGRYDKRFCTPGDIVHYQPGEHFTTFEFKGVKCALLICYDLRFPELYRELKKMNVECVFQSFYNARQEEPSVHSHIMRQTMQCRAATNYFWVSMTNSCAKISPYPCCFIQPDGKIIAQLKDHEPDMGIQTVDTSRRFYDASAPYRDLAIKGILSNRCEYKKQR
ncbi:MAG: carbon-nitrogen hydrolase family protein [Sedimentisphaeraceae bacterium JB056]